MKLTESDDRSPERFSDAVKGLEQLGRRLDCARYPGIAWRAPKGGRSVRFLGKVGALVMGVAAGIALAVYFWPASRPLVGPAPQVAAVPSAGGLSERVKIPCVFIVEDANSYCVIDLMGGTPIVSFALRNSPVFESIVPMPWAASAAATTQNTHL